MNYHSLIFDLDGTISDSGHGIMRCAKHALNLAGIEVENHDALRVFVGPPLVETFQKFGIPEEDVDQAIKDFRVLYHAEGKYENTPYDGIEEVLKTLKEHHFKLFIGTSKPEALAKDVLHRFGLDIYFDMICGATYDHSRETKADVLRYLLTLVETGDTVMIGDTIYDVNGANELGIPCIGVSWGYGSVEEMTKAGIIDLANSPEELQEILLRD